MRKFPGPAVLLLACKNSDGPILVPVAPDSAPTPGILIPEGPHFAHDACVKALQGLGAPIPRLGTLHLHDFLVPLRRRQTHLRVSQKAQSHLGRRARGVKFLLRLARSFLGDGLGISALFQPHLRPGR